MANGKRSRWKVLAVACGPLASAQPLPGPQQTSGSPAAAPFSPADFIRSFPGLHELQGGEAEVQFIERPTLQVLQNIAQGAQPNLVFFSERCHSLGSETNGASSDHANITAPLMLGEAEPPSPEDLAQVFSDHPPDLILANVVLTPRHAELLRSKGVQHVIYWPAPPDPPAATQFFTAVFACLRNPSVSPHDSFRLAEAALRIHCPSPKPLNPQTPHPTISGIPPPRSISCPLELQQRIPPNGSLSVSVLFKPQQELRLLLYGGPQVLEPPRTQALGEGLRVLLAAEVRGLRLAQHAAAGAPSQEIEALGAQHEMVFGRCELCAGNGARVAVTAIGRPEAFEDRKVLEYHLKRHLFDQSALQTLHKPPSLLPARRTTTIASGGPTCEVTITLPDWGKDLLIQLAADVSYRPLAALGLAGVGGLAVAAFSQADGERLSGLDVETREGASVGGGSLENGGESGALKAPPESGKPGIVDSKPGLVDGKLGLVDGDLGPSTAGMEAGKDAALNVEEAAKRAREEDLRANLRAWKRAADASLERNAPVARPVLRRFRQQESLAPVTPEQAVPVVGGPGVLRGVTPVSLPVDLPPSGEGGLKSPLNEHQSAVQNGPPEQTDERS